MKLFHNCTILRTRMEITYTWNIVTGEKGPEHSQIVTSECGIPLFSTIERETGICTSCHKGWEADGNRFANDDERIRAMKEG